MVAQTAKGGLIALALLVSVWALPAAILVGQASASVSDPHVVRFEAVPSFINLNRTTQIEVEIGSSYGAGQDNYSATVTAPDSTQWSLWYNFSSVGTIGMDFGDPGAGFMTIVDQVGSYDLFLEYFNGSLYTPAASAQFSVTDQLNIVLEPASASNEYTDEHTCPITQEFQRGGEIIARAYVTYASTGENVNGTETPTAAGNITGTLLGETKELRWHSTYHFWRWAWYIPWDAPSGAFVFSVEASDGLGNHGSALSPGSGLTAWSIRPAILKVVTRILDDSGDETTLFRPGETVTVEATVTYEGHNAHNSAFPGPLTDARGGQVEATLGWGQFNTGGGVFENFLTNITLALDVASETWVGTYSVPSNSANITDVQAWVMAIDSNNPPNAGSAFTSRFSIQKLPDPIEVPVEVPVEVSTGFELPVVIGIAVALLVAGVAVGMVVFRFWKPKSPGGKPPEEMDN